MKKLTILIVSAIMLIMFSCEKIENCKTCTTKVRIESKGKKLNTHHKAPWSEFTDKRFELSNGITLCKEYHDWVHSKENINNELLCKS